MGLTPRNELRLARLRENLEDRPNDLQTTVKTAHLAYNLGLYDEARSSIARALELGHEDDGTMQIRLARMHVRRHLAATSNAPRDLSAALSAFSKALKFKSVSSKPVHYLEHSKEAVLAKETCAQTLLSRGQSSEALAYYKSLLVSTVTGGQARLTVDGDDRAEVDLPVAGNVLGSESIFLQRKMASEAFRQAWKVLLEQRERGLELKIGAEGGDNDDIGMVLRQAGRALRMNTSAGLAREVGGGVPDGGGILPLSVDSCGSIPEGRGAHPKRGRWKFSLFDRGGDSTRRPSSPAEDFGQDKKLPFPTPEEGAVRTRVWGGGTTKEEVAAAVAFEAATRTLGFELWSQDPYTWFTVGEVLLQGKCYALAIAFLDKAVGLLPPGLELQEKEKHLPVYMRHRREPGEVELEVPTKFGLAQLYLLRAENFFQLGRFSDAHAEAKNARDIDPFGKAVRLLCPRLMALHSEDARSQYTRESLFAVRLQRAWRGHRVLQVLRDMVAQQVAAMRIQRFMRQWMEHNRGLALWLVATSAIEVSGIQAGHTRGIGPTAAAAARERLEALTRSAVSLQRTARVFLSRGNVLKRREAIATLQAFCRGCRDRVVLSAALEEAWRGLYRAHGRDVGDESGHTGDAILCAGCVPRGDARETFSTDKCSMQVGRLTRRSMPMDSGSPEGFDSPNLAAFLWDRQGKENDGFDGVETLSIPHFNVEDRCPYANDAVFELSATAAVSGDTGDGFTFYGVFHQPSVRPSWVPLAVAPDASLARALQCSTLIVNSPSFGSVCARRLFSRVGRPAIPTVRKPTAFPVSEAANTVERQAGDATATPERGKDTKNGPHQLQGDRLTHILVLGDSPIGDGGLSEISSVLRHGWLPRLTSLVIGGPGCRVGPRGVMALARALSSSGCLQLRSLSMSNCCLGRRQPHLRRHLVSRMSRRSLLGSAPTTATAAREAGQAWDCFFRHLQRLPALSSLSLQSCGLEDRDIRSASIAIQILPQGRLRCLRLNGNRIGVSGLRMLLRALTSRRIRLPALWLRQQRPALVENQARTVVTDAFAEGLFAEVELERPFDSMGGRSQLVLIERTAESEDLGIRAVKHTTSNIYL